MTLDVKPEAVSQALGELHLRLESQSKLHRDLCLRVSQNHDALTGLLGDTRHDVVLLAEQQRESAERISKLEAKVEQIDNVLDHDTDSMLLSSLCKRVADLELRAADRPSPKPLNQLRGSSVDGVVHNFGATDGYGFAAVTLDPLADSRGLSVCIDGHHMRGHFLIIPWEAITKKRAQRDKAAESINPGYPSARAWWRQ